MPVVVAPLDEGLAVGEAAGSESEAGALLKKWIYRKGPPTARTATTATALTIHLTGCCGRGIAMRDIMHPYLVPDHTAITQNHL
jgi:hypothetical protein